jgi:hypothetical protein
MPVKREAVEDVYVATSSKKPKKMTGKVIIDLTESYDEDPAIDPD